MLLSRQEAEEKRGESSAALTSVTQAHEAEIARLRQALADGKTRIDILNHQLTQTERERSLVECDTKTLQRRVTALTQENVALKEEVSGHLASGELTSGKSL